MQLKIVELITAEYTVNRFFLKLFRTGNIEVVKNCQAYFEFSLPSVVWAERAKKLDAKFVTCDRTFVHYGLCVNFWVCPLVLAYRPIWYCALSVIIFLFFYVFHYHYDWWIKIYIYIIVDKLQLQQFSDSSCSWLCCAFINLCNKFYVCTANKCETYWHTDIHIVTAILYVNLD